MELSERNLLLDSGKSSRNDPQNLSVFFAVVCIVDIFGVFPIVTLPKAIIDCGFYGILVISLVCSIQIYTTLLLGRCWIIAEEIDSSVQRKNRYPYSALAEITFGTYLSNFVSLLLDITVFGGAIPNLIVASQNLQLLGLRLSNNNFDISYCYWILALGMILCPVLWLGSPKDMKFLCSISVSIVVLVFILLIGCFIFSPSEAPQNIDLTPQRPLWELIFTSYGIISFQFDIHPSILTIQVDMKEKSKLPVAVFGGFFVSLGMFAIVATTVAVKYGTSLKPSVLETLPTTFPLHFAAFFVALQLCLSSAVSNNALYQHMEDCLKISRGKAFNHRRCVLRTTLTLLAVLIAESVPRFDLVMSLIGGTLTGPLVFMLPPLFYLKMLSLQKKHDKQLALESFANIIYSSEDKVSALSNYVEDEVRKEFETGCALGKKLETTFCASIVAGSIVCTVVTSYVNVKNAIAFANFSQPCIFNVSSALLNL